MKFASDKNNQNRLLVSGKMSMKFLRRVIDQIKAINQKSFTASEHIHMARAYRPMTPKMLPRWRNLGIAITPYHYMRPVVIPVQPKQVQRNSR